MGDLPTLRDLEKDILVSINTMNFTIGRSLSCNHVMDSLSISRLHCTIKKINNTWRLFDNSTNGTIVNSRNYKQNEFVPLKNGDIITFPEAENSYNFVFNDPLEVDKRLTQEIVIPKETATNPEVIVVPDSEMEAVTPPKTKATEEMPPSSDKAKEEPPEPEKSKSTPTVHITKQDFDLMEAELTCSICSELFIKAMTLNCSHTFCEHCINQWKHTKNTCPICRNAIHNIAPTIVLDNFIEKKIELCSNNLRETRDAIIKERRELVQATSSGSKPSTSNFRNDSIIEIDDEDDDETFDDDDDYAHDDYWDMDDEFLDWDGDSDYEDVVRTPYNGVPGHYYGGYGSCYICKQKGHWATGCPRRHQ